MKHPIKRIQFLHLSKLYIFAFQILHRLSQAHHIVDLDSTTTNICIYIYTQISKICYGLVCASSLNAKNYFLKEILWLWKTINPHPMPKILLLTVKTYINASGEAAILWLKSWSPIVCVVFVCKFFVSRRLSHFVFKYYLRMHAVQYEAKQMHSEDPGNPVGAQSPVSFHWKSLACVKSEHVRKEMRGICSASWRCALWLNLIMFPFDWCSFLSSDLD